MRSASGLQKDLSPRSIELERLLVPVRLFVTITHHREGAGRAETRQPKLRPSLDISDEFSTSDYSASTLNNGSLFGYRT
jgi:hypothetical protein